MKKKVRRLKEETALPWSFARKKSSEIGLRLVAII